MSDFNRHAKNLISLVAIQGANALLPLVVFPFALSVVGPDHYKQIVQGEAASLFLLTFVLYGFEVTGVAALVGSDPKRDAGRIAFEFSAITYLRLILFAIAAPPILAGVYCFDPGLAPLTAAWMLIPLSFAISPNWLYLSLEHNLPLAISTLISRALALAAIFVTVRSADDQLYVPLVLGICYCLGALAACAIALSRLGAGFVRVPPSELLRRVIAGRDIFLGNLSVTLYRDLNVLLMSFLGSSSGAIASYSVAEKFAKALQATVRPLNQFYFPRAMAMAKIAGSPSPQLLFSMFRIVAPLLAVLLMLIISASLAYRLLDHPLPLLARLENSDRIVLLVAIMSVATLIGSSTNVLGNAGLNALDLSRYFLLAIVATGITSLLGTSLLIVLYADIGAAVGFVLAEIILFALVARKFFTHVSHEAGTA